MTFRKKPYINNPLRGTGDLRTVPKQLQSTFAINDRLDILDYSPDEPIILNVSKNYRRL